MGIVTSMEMPGGDRLWLCFPSHCHARLQAVQPAARSAVSVFKVWFAITSISCPMNLPSFGFVEATPGWPLRYTSHRPCWYARNFHTFL